MCECPLRSYGMPSFEMIGSDKIVPHNTLESYICNYIQGVLALCEFHYCEFGYCGFSKLLLKICLMRFLCTITLVNADISYRYMPNAIFG